MTRDNSFESGAVSAGPSLEKSQENLGERIEREERRLRENLNTLKDKLENAKVAEMSPEDARATKDYTAEIFNICVAVVACGAAVMTYIKAVNEADPSTQEWIQFSLLAIATLGPTLGYFKARKNRLEGRADDVDEGNDLEDDQSGDSEEFAED